MGTRRGAGDARGSLGQTGSKHPVHFRLEEGVPEVEEAGGGRPPLAPQEVQAPLGTLAVELVAVHLGLCGDSPTLHGFRTREVATNVEGDVLCACHDGTPDLLPVDEGVPLVPEKVQQALKSSLLDNKEKDIIMV